MRGFMQDFLNLTMLVLAATAAMLLGVLAAYGMFKVGFWAMRWHTGQSAPSAVEARVARVRQA